jgi:predicted acetyltransferase
MSAPREVTLQVAAEADTVVLSNLLELYIHDLSEIFSLEIGDGGRYGYDRLPLYWSEPGRRFPFLIRSGARIAGFTLVTRGSPMSDDREDLDVAEFFVLRRHRRAGVGRTAAFLLWNRLPGRWIVRVSEGNRAGLLFWAAVIGEYTGAAFSESQRSGDPHGWRVFSFTSGARTERG